MVNVCDTRGADVSFSQANSVHLDSYPVIQLSSYLEGQLRS